VKEKAKKSTKGRDKKEDNKTDESEPNDLISRVKRKI